MDLLSNPYILITDHIEDGPWEPFVTFNFPPFAVVKDKRGRMIIGGGGGRGRTGVPNKLIIVEIGPESTEDEVLRHQNLMKHYKGNISSSSSDTLIDTTIAGKMRKVCTYDTGELAVMNMAIHPTENLLACGVEDRCRVYRVGWRSFQLLGEVVTDFCESEEERGQKRVRITPDGRRMVTSGGDGAVRVWDFASLSLLHKWDALSLESDKETVDLSVTNHLVVVASRSRCLVLDIHNGTILFSTAPSAKALSFRDARFCPILLDGGSDLSDEVEEAEALHDNSDSESGNDSNSDADDDMEVDNYENDTGIELENTVKRKSGRRSRHQLLMVPTPPSPCLDSQYLYTTEFQPQQMSVIRKWDVSTWHQVQKTVLRYQSDHGTALSISPDGSTLAIGSVEGQLRILRASDLKEVKRWPNLHEFFITDFAFLYGEEQSSAHLSGTDTMQTDFDVSSMIITDTVKRSRRHNNNPTSSSFPQVSLLSTSGDNTLRITKIPNLSTTLASRFSYGVFSFISYAIKVLFMFAILFLLFSSILIFAHVHYPELTHYCWKSLGDGISQLSGDYEYTSLALNLLNNAQTLSHMIYYNHTDLFQGHVRPYLLSAYSELRSYFD